MIIRGTIKRIDELNSIIWGMYEWHEVTGIGDTARVFMRGRERSVEDAVKAQEEFAEYVKMFQALKHFEVTK